MVDESIAVVIKKRQVKSQVRGLTEHDLFFREVNLINKTCLTLKAEDFNCMPPVIGQLVFRNLPFEDRFGRFRSSV